MKGKAKLIPAVMISLILGLTITTTVPTVAFAQHVQTIGLFGMSNGQFNNPNGIYHNGTHFFIADTSNHRVQIFDASGLYKTQLGTGTSGTANNQLSFPEDVTANQSHILVADRNNDRIQVFDLAGTYQSTIGLGSGSGDGQFSNPSGITMNETHIFTVESGVGNYRVQIFTLDGQFQQKIGTGNSGNGNYEFTSPNNVILNGTHIFVVDTMNDRIQIFDTQGIYIQTLGITDSDSSAPGEFNNPNDLAIHPITNRLFVADNYNHRIQILEANGDYVGMIGTGISGPENSEIASPRDLSINETHVLVSSATNDHIQIFKLEPSVVTETTTQTQTTATTTMITTTTTETGTQLPAQTTTVTSVDTEYSTIYEGEETITEEITISTDYTSTVIQTEQKSEVVLGYFGPILGFIAIAIVYRQGSTTNRT